jgi:hypothetical protein
MLVEQAKNHRLHAAKMFAVLASLHTLPYLTVRFTLGCYAATQHHWMDSLPRFNNVRRLQITGMILGGDWGSA